jgi:hypothetical protein
MKRVLGAALAAAFAISALGASALAISPVDQDAYTGPFPLTAKGKAVLCHYTGHSHILNGVIEEFDYLILTTALIPARLIPRPMRG